MAASLVSSSALILCRSLVPTKCFKFTSSFKQAPSGYCLMSSTKEYLVSHDSTRNEFYIPFEKGKGVLQYEVLDPFTIELWHTEVPESLRGKGLAKVLAKAAMDYVVEENMKMVVTCTYLKKYLQENPNPDYISRLVDSE